jgi:hypothetical protein
MVVDYQWHAWLASVSPIAIEAAANFNSSKRAAETTPTNFWFFLRRLSTGEN